MVHKIRHVGINVKHLTRSIRFYEQLGFTADSGGLEAWAGQEINIIKMRSGSGNGCLLELVRGIWQPHFAVTVDEMPIGACVFPADLILFSDLFFLLPGDVDVEVCALV